MNRLLRQTTGLSPKMNQEIKPLKKFLEENQNFQRASLKYHSSKMGLVDKIIQSFHEEAFPEQKKAKKLHELEEKKK